MIDLGTRVVITIESLVQGKAGNITHISYPWSYLGDPQPAYTVRFDDGSGRIFGRNCFEIVATEND